MGAKSLGSRAIIGEFYMRLEQDLGVSWVPHAINAFPIRSGIRDVSLARPIAGDAGVDRRPTGEGVPREWNHRREQEIRIYDGGPGRLDAARQNRADHGENRGANRACRHAIGRSSWSTSSWTARRPPATTDNSSSTRTTPRETPGRRTTTSPSISRRPRHPRRARWKRRS